MKTSSKKLFFICHIAVSIGWFGAVTGFLALAILGLNSQDDLVVRSTYLAMDIIARFTIVPLAFASVLTGIVQSLVTPWGLFRHTWIVTKLLLTIFATVILLLKMKIIGHVANYAVQATLSPDNLRQERVELLVHAAGGLVVLLVIITISVFKPWGKTLYWKRKSEVKNDLKS